MFLNRALTTRRLEEAPLLSLLKCRVLQEMETL